MCVEDKPGGESGGGVSGGDGDNLSSSSSSTMATTTTTTDEEDELLPPTTHPSSCSLSSTSSSDNPFDAIYGLSMVRPTEGRTFFICRHGESEYNVEERIGGDPPLTDRGQRFARTLGSYINDLDLPNLRIWTSTLRRTIATAGDIVGPRSQTHLLDEIGAGYLDGLTYQEVEKMFPEEWVAREEDKLRYRYPGGESYLDCCVRIVPLLIKMESCDNLVIVAHQAILRCVFGYLLKKPIESVPFIKIPQHALMQVTMEGGENIVDFIRMPVDHVEQGVTVASTENQEVTPKKFHRQREAI